MRVWYRRATRNDKYCKRLRQDTKQQAWCKSRGIRVWDKRPKAASYLRHIPGSGATDLVLTEYLCYICSCQRLHRERSMGIWFDQKHRSLVASLVRALHYSMHTLKNQSSLLAILIREPIDPLWIMFNKLINVCSRQQQQQQQQQRRQPTEMSSPHLFQVLDSSNSFFHLGAINTGSNTASRTLL